jgi:FG-GAP-like repeat
MKTLPALTLEGGGVIAAGDINGNGWIDLAIVKWFHDTVLVYYGGPVFDTIPAVILHSPMHTIYYGLVIAVGDLKQDGKKDIIAIGWNGLIPNSNKWYYYLSIFLGNQLFQVKRDYYIDSRKVRQ